jgi:hypothetical protein
VVNALLDDVAYRTDGIDVNTFGVQDGSTALHAVRIFFFFFGFFIGVCKRSSR